MPNIQQMKFHKEEQETYANFDPIAEMWTIYTARTKDIRNLSKKAISMNVDYKVLTEWEGKPTSIELIVPNSLFNSNFLKPKRKISEEHKAALVMGRLKKNKLLN